jgi:hypothetical protein
MSFGWKKHTDHAGRSDRSMSKTTSLGSDWAMPRHAHGVPAFCAAIDRQRELRSNELGRKEGRKEGRNVSYMPARSRSNTSSSTLIGHGPRHGTPRHAHGVRASCVNRSLARTMEQGVWKETSDPTCLPDQCVIPTLDSDWPRATSHATPRGSCILCGNRSPA